ncbi:MAG: sigma-70 family RNA polymerase sigma factor [Bacteroidales bacterium]|nr:sigma-70 family RNA polymerase sigma factor [Bacteroidales bacterium]
MSDKELLDRIRNKDKGAFKHLVDNYNSLVLNICNSFLHNFEDSQDVSQEVFIEVYKSIDKFRGESKISTWLYRISVNKSLNHIRKNKRNAIFRSFETIIKSQKKETENLAESNESENDFENDKRSRVLYEALDSLPQNQKIAFNLSKLNNMKYKEISEVMNVSVSSVESLIFRAKKNLQKKLINIYKEN